MMICEFCGAKFKDGRELANHMRAKYSGLYLRAGFRKKYTSKNATFIHNDISRTKSNSSK